MTNEEKLAQALAPQSDTLGGDDLVSGPRTITITSVHVKRGQERPLIIMFEGDDGKPWKPCKTTGRSLAKLWGGDFEKWAGRSVRLVRDPDVTYGGVKIGGIRIEAVTHIDGKTEVAERLNGKQMKVRKIEPLKIEAKPDRAADGVAELIARIQNSDDVDAIEADPAVVHQRKWLAKERPDLAAQVDAAFNGEILEGAE